MGGFPAWRLSEVLIIPHHKNLLYKQAQKPRIQTDPLVQPKQ
jgi:hypothetical protein